MRLRSSGERFERAHSRERFLALDFLRLIYPVIVLIKRFKDEGVPILIPLR